MLFRSNDTATTEIYTCLDTLSLHDALPISFGMAETAIYGAVISLVFWLAPAGMAPDASQLFSGQVQGALAHTLLGAYMVAVLCVEPYYVAAGFAMYLNRRVELEAWDIEQEFRRAFDH